MAITRDTRVTRSRDILIAPVSSDEGVILSVEQGRYYGLNPVAARVCELLDTTMTVAEISARMCEEFEVDRETSETEILTFVSTLVANGIVRAET